jgi:hypothetical protein
MELFALKSDLLSKGRSRHRNAERGCRCSNESPALRVENDLLLLAISELRLPQFRRFAKGGNLGLGELKLCIYCEGVEFTSTLYFATRK